MNCSCLSKLSSIIVVLAAAIGLTFAQDAPPKDPFKQKAARPVAKPDAAHNQRMVVFSVEFIEAPKDQTDLWAGNPNLSDDEVRREVEKLIESGDAQVIDSALLQAKSGHRAKIESHQELFYPTSHEVLDIDPSGPTFPGAFESRNCGLDVEIDPVIGPDQTTIDLNFSIDRSEYAGDIIRDPRDGVRVLETDVILPLIATQKVVTSISVQIEEYNLVGQFEPFAAEKTKTRRILLFVRAGIQVITPTKLTDELPQNLQFRFEWVQVKATDWNSWLTSQKLVDAPTTSWPVIQQLLADRKATSLSMQVLRTRNGQRTKTTSAEEEVYTTEYKAPQVVGGVCESVAHEMRLTGFYTELDPVAGAHGALFDMNYNPTWVLRGRDLVSYRKKSADEGNPWIPAVTMPLFYTNRLISSSVLAGGTTQLIGVGSPPDSDGNADRTRKVLLFVHDDTIPPAN